MKELAKCFVATITTALLVAWSNDLWADAATVRIQVDPNTELLSIPADFIGFGYETSAVAREGFFSIKNEPMVKLYRTLGTRGLVRIGGIIGDHTRYVADGKPMACDQKGTTVINKAVLVELAGFLHATGWKALWTLNLGTGSKAEAAEEAIAVSAALGPHLHSFEIGNEVDALKRFKNYDDYHAAYLDYKSAVRAALPGARFSGPDCTGHATPWAIKFAQAESNDMAFLLHHYYCGDAHSPKATIPTMLAPDPRFEDRLKTLQDLCTAKQIAFRINEVNSFSSGGKPDVSDTFAEALWCLDYMFQMASCGGAGVNMETDVNQLGFVSHYSPIYRSEDGRLTARPEYYGMLAFSLAGKGKLLKLTTSETNTNLREYATKADGALWVTMVNKDLARSVEVEIPLPPNITTAETYRLAAPSIGCKSGVTLAGAEVTTDGKWQPRVIDKAPVANGKASISLPAASAMLLRLK